MNQNQDSGSRKNPKLTARTIKVSYLTRVEGEGSLFLKTRGGQLEDIQLRIFEPPRFFEALLRGRSYEEAPDISARVCGICPVAYQMSATHAIEQALQVVIPEHIRNLRRLLYCGEWIESHCLHIFMLHAPDFLGYPDAISMARQHRPWVEDGLRMKKIGNKLMGLIGGREIHPINIRVGGFYALPGRTQLLALLDELKWAIDASYDTLLKVSSFDFPDITIEYDYVALHHPLEYPFNEGRIRSSKGLEIDAAVYEQNFEEVQVPHSTALQSFHKGYGSYLTGPVARIFHNRMTLSKRVQDAVAGIGFQILTENPYRSIQARTLELMYSFEEAVRLISLYDDTLAPYVSVKPLQSMGCAATEAPRGLLYQRYELDSEGLIKEAKIVPPTSQNQKRIEDDLGLILRGQLERQDSELVEICEKAIRNYDPCISCAAHFLNLKLARE